MSCKHKNVTLYFTLNVLGDFNFNPDCEDNKLCVAKWQSGKHSYLTLLRSKHLII